MRRLVRRAAITGTTIAALLAGPFGTMPARATPCFGIAGCHVEWTILGGYYERGVSAAFTTYTGPTADSRVMSISLILPGSGGEEVEFGWHEHPAPNDGFKWFWHYKIWRTDHYDERTLESTGTFVGAHTYRIEYDPSLNRFVATWDGNYKASITAGSWTAALPITNVERHSELDTFPPQLTFWALEYRSASAWYAWNQLGARCFLDDDPDWSGSYDSSTNILYVDAPSNGSCSP